jgi:predicted permease
MRRLIDRLVLRMRSLFRGSRVDRSLRREIEVHLQEEIDENVAAGMTPTDARTAALRSFGPIAAIEEQCRDTRRVALVESLVRDFRYAGRALARQPLLVAASTLSMAAAIGANTTVFNLTRELLYAQPSVQRPEELVHLRFGGNSHVPLARWRDLNESGALAGMVGFNFERQVTWKGPQHSISIVPLMVTANFFDVLQLPMAQGRGFTAGEADADREPAVAVITHWFWQHRLDGRADVLDTPLTINGRPYAVLGVLPENFRSILGFGLAPEMYLPMSRILDAELGGIRGGLVQVVGRLRHGQSLDQGRAAVIAVAERLGSAYNDKGFRNLTQFVRAGTFIQAQGSKVIDGFFTVLLIAVGFVLAIACANVSGLLLARATARRREIALRLALGASRSRLVQQLLIEGLWLSMAGALGGLFLMYLLIRAISQVSLPIPLPLAINLDVSAPLWLYTLGLIVGTTVLSALAPALHATRASPVHALKLNVLGPQGRWTLRRLLVISQIAVALMLLLTAALFLRDLTRARQLDLGFDVSNTLVATVGLLEGRYSAATSAAMLDRALERVRALPGVSTASYAYGAPMTVRHGMTNGTTIRVITENREFHAVYHVDFVSPGYLDTLDIPLVGGRDFTTRDRDGAPRAVIVNDLFAQRYFPDSSALGQVITLPGEGSSYRAEIVGISGNGKYLRLGENPMAAIYLPYAQRTGQPRFVHLFARTHVDPDTLRRDVALVLASVDPLAAVDVKSMRSTLAFAFMPTEVGTALLTALGMLGLILALAGMFASRHRRGPGRRVVSRRTARHVPGLGPEHDRSVEFRRKRRARRARRRRRGLDPGPPRGADRSHHRATDRVITPTDPDRSNKRTSEQPTDYLLG